jgi:hypothetical protein
MVKVLRLDPHIVDGKLFQWIVVAKFGNEDPMRIGYVGILDTDYFAPLCYFPMENCPEVQRQIDFIKEEKLGELARKTDS